MSLTLAEARARAALVSDVSYGAFPAVALDDAQVALLRRTLDGSDVPTVLRRSWEDRYDDLTGPG